MKNIWQDLPRPILILAPMEDVTDTVFRRIVGYCGAPDLYFTEFTSVDGLFSKGYEYVAKRLEFTKSEKPLIAQIWGGKPENYAKAAKMLVEMGFDGIDINMGCPEKRVVSQGMCSALINNRPLAQEIIQATKESAGNLPVSVKTRIGFKEIQTEDWISFLLEQNIDALTIHGRTAKEMSAVPAHWDEIGKGAEIRDQMGLKTLIIGNGDVLSRSEALEKAGKYKLDGIMIGRGIFQDPWLFNKEHHGQDVTFSEKAEMLSRHADLFEKVWGEKKHFPIMKKFFKCYVNNIDNASEIRESLMKCENGKEVKAYLKQFIS